METLSLPEPHHAGFSQRHHLLEITSFHGCHLGHQLILAFLFSSLFSPCPLYLCSSGVVGPQARVSPCQTQFFSMAVPSLPRKQHFRQSHHFPGRFLKEWAWRAPPPHLPLVGTVPGLPWTINIFKFGLPLL